MERWKKMDALESVESQKPCEASSVSFFFVFFETNFAFVNAAAGDKPV